MANNEKIPFLQNVALNLRIDSIRATTASGSGHPTTCLSAADLIAALYFHVMQFDVNDPHNENNDRFILSKGHGIPVVYAAYKQLGVITDEQLMDLRKFDSPLEGHPTPRFEYNEAATGSLGQGLAIACGMALNAKKDKKSYKTYVMLGDGEIAEGSVWEAAEFAAYYQLDNLVGIIDLNRFGQSGESLYDHRVETVIKRFDAFGWHAVAVDGHNMDEIVATFEKIKAVSAKPVMIVAKTFKGYGLKDVENKNGYHGKPFKKEELDRVVEELKVRFADAAAVRTSRYIPLRGTLEANGKETNRTPIAIDLTTDANTARFDIDQKMPTRKAYGYALAALGRESTAVYALDGDVKNSTYSDIFEKECPERFVQCFIAEQTMVGVATGLQARGKIPFAATFGAFFTRAHDQIRMASVGRNALRLCGSHCGVSIGQDGPSQMALEDIAMMRAIPDSIVLYPSDAVSAFKLTECMANYHDGISFLRTTRSATSILYDKKEEFKVGGCKVLKQSDNDSACIVAAGITLHEALKAYEQLKEKGVHVSVIDAYSVKPLDAETIIDVAKKSGNRVITVEDHYIQGGLGEAVTHALSTSPFALSERSESNGFRVETLAVTQISRSGTPEKLMRYAGINAEGIVKLVLK